MNMDFNDRGHLVGTDYWVHEAGSCTGKPWIAVRSNVWHVLLPNVPGLRLKKLVAMPVTAKDEASGWQWKLWIKPDIHWAVHVPLENFMGGRLPSMPERGSYYQTSIQFYGEWLPGFSGKVLWNFGHFDNDGLVPRLAWSNLLVARPVRDWRSFVLNLVEVEVPKERRAGDSLIH